MYTLSGKYSFLNNSKDVDFFFSV